MKNNFLEDSEKFSEWLIYISLLAMSIDLIMRDAAFSICGSIPAHYKIQTHVIETMMANHNF